MLVALVWAFAGLPYLTSAMRCPTARLFRYPCPGCGMTRAFRLLASGDVASSLAMHPLAAPTALVQGLLAAATIGATLRFGAPWLLIRARWGRAAIAAVVLVGVLDLALWIARGLGAFSGPVPV